MNPQSSTLGLIFLVCLLTVLHAYGVLAYVVISKSRSARVRKLLKRKVLGASTARTIVGKVDHHLLAHQIWIFATSVLIGLVGEVLVEDLYVRAPHILLGAESWGSVHYPLFVKASVAVGVFCAIFAFALMGVQLARVIAYANPERVLCSVAWAIWGVSAILRPAVIMAGKVVDRVARTLGLRGAVVHERAVSAEEIGEIVEISSRAGTIGESNKKMIQGVLGLALTRVREVMTPRSEIVSVAISASLEHVRKVVLSERVSRLLVVGTSLDDIRGVLLVKDLLPFLGDKERTFDISRVVRPALVVPASRRVDELLTELRHNSTHLAVVMDEHGGVDGVVSIEDLIEEVVGEIYDEHDAPIAAEGSQRTSSGDLVLDGTISIEDLRDQYHVSIPKGSYDTLAGYILEQLEVIPEVGATLELPSEHGSIQLRVEVMQNHRISRVRLIGVPVVRKVARLDQSYEPNSADLDSNEESQPQPRRSGVVG